jgi:hypothetical protein
MRWLFSLATIGVAVALALIVILGILNPGQQAFVWLENMRVGADIFQKIVAAIALIIGGLFAYFKFIREGTHDPRLQPSVTGKAVIDDEVIYVVATVTTLNTGVVDVHLPGEGAAVLEIYETSPGGDGWTYIGITPVFENHFLVQPGQTIEDHIWLEIPYENQVGIKSLRQ